MKLVPEPVVQLVPLFVLYSHFAVSAPLVVTLICPLLVIPSLLLLPVSAAKAKVAAVGAVVSTVTAAKLVTVLLPAASEALTCTWFRV